MVNRRHYENCLTDLMKICNTVLDIGPPDPTGH